MLRASEATEASTFAQASVDKSEPRRAREGRRAEHDPEAASEVEPYGTLQGKSPQSFRARHEVRSKGLCAEIGAFLLFGVRGAKKLFLARRYAD